MDEQRIAAISAWIEDNAAADFGADRFFDYVEACIDEESDIGLRYDMRIRFDALKAALIGDIA